MIDRLLRNVFAPLVISIARALRRAGLTGNALTVLGFLTICVSAYFNVRGLAFASGWVLLGGGGFDMLDGAVARLSGVGSKRGAFLDSTLDRLSDGVMLAGVAASVSSKPAVLGALAALVTSFGVSYTKARAEGLGVPCTVGIAERSDRIVIVVAGLVFGFIEIAVWVLAALSAFTLIQRFTHVWRKLER